MEIQYYGANSIRITTKKANIIIDGLMGGGAKSLIKNGDTVLFTDKADRKVENEVRLLIDKPGEYEIADTAILGIPARSYKGEAKTFDNTIYKIENEEVKLAIIGNIHPELSDTQLELLGEVDVIVIPVGNHEITLSGSDALSIVKNIEPFVVIPTHYDDAKVKYETPQATLAEALKELAMEPAETVPKLKLKSANFNEGDTVKLIVLGD
jgi:L-ascorbate metabolism protein UlaG (beta-lactamase superfamily)